jgi:hypothetical protein
MTLAVAGLSACAAPTTGDSPHKSTPTAVADPQRPDPSHPDPAPTETVPAPNGGTVDDVLPEPAPAPTQQVAIDEPAKLPDGVILSVSDVENVDITPETPGEVAGPAVAVRLTVQNKGSATIDLSSAMVSAVNSAGTLGQPTVARPAAPFTGQLPVGAEATAVYVFMFPADQRNGLTITAEYIAGAPIALFVG